MQLPRATRLVVVGRGASYHGDAGTPAYSPSYQPEGDGAYPPYSGSPGYGGHHSGDEPPKIGFALTLRQGPPATVSSVGGLWRSVALGEIGAPERARSSAIFSARWFGERAGDAAFFRRNIMFQLANVPSSRPPDPLRPAHP
jgi:hypothetical protein